MAELTREALVEFARARGIPLPDARVDALLEQVNGLFEFTRELDAHLSPETMPATVFDAGD